MRGRRPSGPEYVNTLGGSDTAKERLKVILETLAGTCRVQEACARLGISEPRFHQLRTQMLEAARAGLEPQTPGRKPQTLTPAEEQVRLLQQQVQQQDFELRVARAREEVALTLPRLLPEPEAKASEKKTSPPQGPPSKRRHGRPPKNPGSPPGKRKST
jgi:transposase-like protein